MTNPSIRAIGTAVPANRISQEAYYSILQSANGMSREQQLILRKIYNRSGIEFRHSVLDEFSHEDGPLNTLFHPSGKYESTPVSTRMEIYEHHAADLCAEAVHDCLSALPALLPEHITHLVTFSCTGMYAPGLDIQLVEKIGLSRSVERTCINFMGCYAAINSLKVAYHIARSVPDAVVLLAGVELCSLHYRKSNEPDQVVANALFADGAAAAIVTASGFQKDDNQLSLRLEDFYAEFEESAGDDMVWRIGNDGFDLKLSPGVPQVVQDNIGQLAAKLFLRTGLQQEDIDLYAIHPGGTKILEACEQALGISPEQNKVAYDVLRNYGNMSSVTILFVLKRLLASLSATDTGKRILACAFGPGITMESMILQIC